MLLAAGKAYLTRLTVTSSYASGVLPALLIMGLGFGMISAPAINTATAGVARHYRLFRPDLENPTQQDAEPVYRTLNVLPVPYVEPDDVANALLFLASDEGRYVTGVALPVDAGFAIK
jgi:(+)-trans-carveol dehydrogenase